jgi:sporulation protein YlmC with PRC-barrel domain
MLLSTNELLGYSIHAADGDIGKVTDFYFDDRHWTIRYLVVDVGNWLKDRKVLVSPMSIKMVAVNLGRFMASVTRQQVENSPSWDNQKPVSRQYEELFAKYYDYPYYWGGPYLWGYAPNPAGITLMEANIPQDVSVEEAEAEIEKSHLRSTREIFGYHLVTTDGEIGQVVDFIFAEKNWQFHYLVIDTGKWPANRKTLISPDWIGLINWSKSQVSVQFDKETIRNAPTYDDLVTITPDYEKRLFAYYGRPGYWQTPAERQ